MISMAWATTAQGNYTFEHPANEYRPYYCPLLLAILRHDFYRKRKHPYISYKVAYSVTPHVVKEIYLQEHQLRHFNRYEEVLIHYMEQKERFRTDSLNSLLDLYVRDGPLEYRSTWSQLTLDEYAALYHLYHHNKLESWEPQMGENEARALCGGIKQEIPE